MSPAPCKWILAAVMAWLFLGPPGALVAQDPSESGSGDDPSGVKLVTERTASRGIRRARESIAAGEYAQAIQFLDGVLGQEQDLFIENGADGGYSGLKETAGALIRDLPAEGREAYETAFGPAAQRLLKSAVETGHPDDLQLAARRYFYTPAGAEAAFLLAMDEADAGRHHSAALQYEQLLQLPSAAERLEPHLSIRAAVSWLAAGNDSRAQSLIDRLAAKGHKAFQLPGRQVSLEGGDALEVLRQQVGQGAGPPALQNQQWLTYRGNSARNGESTGGLPHMRVRWKVRLLGHPQLETLYENLAADLVRTGNLAPIASNPIAAGDYVLTRTPHGLLAIDFKTGKRVWRSEPQREPELERLMRAGNAQEEAASNPEPARSFARRLWEDYLYGLVSSDGARVYMIRDLPMPWHRTMTYHPLWEGAVLRRRVKPIACRLMIFPRRASSSGK